MNFTKTVLVTICIAILIPCTSFTQQLIDPDSILLAGTKSNLPKVFLVGSFHFEYYNADAYKTEKDKQIDVLTADKQKELKELLDYISFFKPTKILIEATPEWNAMEKFRQYKSGKTPLKRDERMQIGFRLAERFNLDTIYAVDAGSIADDLLTINNKDSAVVKPYIDSIFSDYQFRANDNYNRFYEYETMLTTKVSLLTYFKYTNSPKVLSRSYGPYLLGDFKLGKFRGADALATYWYDRNLRIFRNIQRITTSANDRILVLFGAGHISVLDQLFRCSPEYDYVLFNDLRETQK